MNFNNKWRDYLTESKDQIDETEITAKISEIPVRPNALKLTHASVDNIRQAISFARAVTTNMEIHTLAK